MKHTVWFGLLLLASGQAASAQPADNLTDQQKLGRQVFAQSCGVCHLPPSLGAKTYGPPLNKDARGGDNDVMREFVGTARRACRASSTTSSPRRSMPSSRM